MTTPIRQQYLRIKRQYPQAILFFRMGDFYETFDEDAKVAARELGITLTSKPMGKNQRVPLAGVPYHAVDSYLAKLIQKGHKVAICEQLSDPATTKGLVEREVVRVITPGTVVAPNLLDQKTNNYLACAVAEGPDAGLAYADITTGEFATTQLPAENLMAELARLKPSELLIPQNQVTDSLPVSVALTRVENWQTDLEMAKEALLAHFRVGTLEGFGCAHLPLAVRAAGTLLQYLQSTQKAFLQQLTSLSTYSTHSFMTLDHQTRRNLELFLNTRQGTIEGSLLGVIDLTQTAMGGRLIKRWLSQPLLDVGELNRRLDRVEALYQNGVARGRMTALLRRIPDLERVIHRVGSGLASPREAVALRRGLEILPQVREAAMEFSGEEPSCFADPMGRLKPCDDVVDLIARGISDDPPASVSEGGVIRRGFSEELDRLVDSSQNAKQYLAGLEQRERERTGIRSLRVSYNKVFGYYIEVTKPNLSQVPDDYLRKQTLVNGERFFTPELKEYEALILNAQERIQELEGSLFRRVCQQVAAASERVLSVAGALGELDVLTSLAEVAARYGYTRPTLTPDDAIIIKEGRHPVVERTIQDQGFVPNDTYLSNQDAQIVVLTGPNMSGKSTYLRQVALMVLLAQVGSFVPAASANIGVVDRIFTRIGAQDDLATGQSTFMVEMVETANILHHATPRSLIVLDEIGRGTSTYDGMSIARAVLEHIHNSPRLGAKTLFATHYHELVDLAATLPRVHNYNVAVVEEGGKVVFLRKIVPGGADRSYGIHVAQLAGLPRPVIHRAEEVLRALESANRGRWDGKRGKEPQGIQMAFSILDQRVEVVEKLAQLDVSALTPMEAINLLYELQQRAQEI